MHLNFFNQLNTSQAFLHFEYKVNLALQNIFLFTFHWHFVFIGEKLRNSGY